MCTWLLEVNWHESKVKSLICAAKCTKGHKQLADVQDLTRCFKDYDFYVLQHFLFLFVVWFKSVQILGILNTGSVFLECICTLLCLFLFLRPAPPSAGAPLFDLQPECIHGGCQTWGRHFLTRLWLNNSPSRLRLGCPTSHEISVFFCFFFFFNWC